mmetsp:Transcript_34894/g.79160  ORF Transcript_34894/g.79160 Transcript_34894/m.79160 type:complete len:92 (+) Transcript_34894:423-698(+)
MGRLWCVQAVALSPVTPLRMPMMRPRWSIHFAKRMLTCDLFNSAADVIVSLLLCSLKICPSMPPLMLDRCHEAFGSNVQSCARVPLLQLLR